MKRILIFFALTFPILLTAQNVEVGLQFGASGYQGDLSPNQAIGSFSSLHPSLGIYGRYNANRYFGYRVNFSYGTVSGDDAQSKDEGRKSRNLSFRSKILELALIGEYNILGRHKRLTPYVFGGIAVFRFNPEANYQGRLIELQPLGTEGQGMDGFGEKYSRTQFAIPMGGGLKFAVSKNFNVSVEMGFRKLFTDYLDDVSGNYVNYLELTRGNGEQAALLSNRTGELLGTEPLLIETGRQRGNPDSKDWYFISNISVSYNLWNDKDSWGGKEEFNEYGCPKF